MTKYITERDLLGEDGTVRMNAQLKDFLEAALDIRTRLGVRSYLLDEYVGSLIRGVTYLCAWEAASHGYDAVMDLNSMCSDCISEDFSHEREAFLNRVRALVDSLPLPFEHKAIKRDVYVLLIQGEYYQEKFGERHGYDAGEMRLVADEVKLHVLADDISAALGSEEYIDRLNDLFLRRFVAATYEAMYMQGVVTSTAFALNSRDPDSGKMTWQLLLENPHLWQTRLK